jgi:hypothetical protein
MHVMKIRAAILIMAALSCSANAFGEACVLFNDNAGQVWLRVYQEDTHGNQGRLIVEVHLAKGEKRQVPNDNGRIRYDYKNDPTDPYHGNVGAWCQHNDSVKVP